MVKRKTPPLLEFVVSVVLEVGFSDRTAPEPSSRLAMTPVVKTPVAWSQVHFLFRDHLGITKEPQFADNVLYLLLDSPR